MADYLTHSQIRSARSMLGLKQSELASKASISRDVLFDLEHASRKRPNTTALFKLRTTFEGEGLVLLNADADVGEGVRWGKPSGKLWVDCLRHGRVMLGDTLDGLALQSGINRYAINRIERGNFRRLPEDAVRQLRETLFIRGVLVLGEEGDLGAGVRFRVGFDRSI